MVFETKEQIIRRKKIARFKFRILARKVFFNKAWLSEIDEQLGEDVKKNVAIILQRNRKKGALTIIEKRILKKSWESRNEEEEEKLKKLFDTLPCFETFTPLIRKKLSKAVEFHFYPQGKQLYLENHLSHSMFFILTGEVVVTQLTFDKMKATFVDESKNILSSGDFFGHLGLIYETPRTASCKTQTDCELLLLHKEDFDILRDTLAERYENIRNAMARFEYFKNYSEAKIKECCVISKIEQYNPQDVIFSQHDISNYSYFLLSGKAMILQCLKIREKPNGRCELVVPKKKTTNVNALELAISKSYTKSSLIAPPDGDGEAGVNYQFFDVGTFRVGAVFGITEEIENRIIIARTTLQCLCIPRKWLFMKSQNVGNVWMRIKLFLNTSIPSQEKLFQEYLMNKKWKKYKQKTIEGIIQQNKIREPETQFYNIPIMCRIQNK